MKIIIDLDDLEYILNKFNLEFKHSTDDGKKQGDMGSISNTYTTDIGYALPGTMFD